MQLYSGNHSFATAGAASMADANFAAAEQFVGYQGGQNCEEKQLKMQFGAR